MKNSRKNYCSPKKVSAPPTETHAQPLKAFQKKGIKLSIWKGKEGNTFYLQKFYRDAFTNEMKTSSSYYRHHLEALQELIKQALEWEESIDNNK